MSKTKLTGESILFIKTNFKAGDPDYGLEALANWFGVSENTIAQIVYPEESPTPKTPPKEKKAPKDEQKPPVERCIFNEWINCDEQDKCLKCGWNPDVIANRKRRLRTSKEIKTGM